MKDRIEELIERIRHLNAELTEELQRKAREYFYEIRDRKIWFDRKVRREHRGMATPLLRYIREASLMTVLTAPVVLAGLPIALLMDLFITVYQHICFRVYGVPLVRRAAYVWSWTATT